MTRVSVAVLLRVSRELVGMFGIRVGIRVNRRVAATHLVVGIPRLLVVARLRSSICTGEQVISRCMRGGEPTWFKSLGSSVVVRCVASSGEFRVIPEASPF